MPYQQKASKRSKIHDPYVGLVIELRKRGIKYKSLSDILHVSVKVISDKINGWSDFTLEEISIICDNLNCSSSVFTQKVTQ